MAARIGIGKLGISLAVVLAAAMLIVGFVFNPIVFAKPDYGICLPSPDLWNIPPVFSWILNIIVIAVITILLFLTNKTFNFVRTVEPVLPAVFLIAAAATPPCTESLNASTLLCLTNIVSLGIIFSAYEKRNATQQMFIAGVFLGIGSMFQYAFIPMFFLYLIWALFMKVLRLKETLAFIAGVFCPYWITVGLGLICLSDFHLPSLTPLLESEADYSDLFFLLVGIGVASIICIIVALINGIKLYAGNSKVNSMNLCINAMGVAMILFIFVDYENLYAYVQSLYLAMAVQIGNTCALWNMRHQWLATVVPSLIYISLFCGMLFL